MTKVQKPIVHGRDHERGGADPIRLVWETDDTGGGGGELVQALLVGPPTTIGANATAYLPFTTTTSYPWLTFPAATHPHVQDAGIYALTANVSVSTGAAAPLTLDLSTNTGYSKTSGGVGAGLSRLSASLTIYMAADEFFVVGVQNNYSSARDFFIDFFVIVKVADVTV